MRTADGSQCGRRVSDSSAPPICHIHRGLNGGVAQSTVEPDDLLGQARRLLRDRDATVRLRAIDLCLKLEERRENRCPSCARRSQEDAERSALLDKVTDHERERLRTLLTDVRGILSAYRSQHTETTGLE